jgi:hypothetical protein
VHEDNARRPVLRRRRNRLLLIGLLIVIGIVAIAVGLSMQEEREAQRVSPMDIEWVDGFAYATVGEGQLLRLTLDGDRVHTEVLADGLEFPRGLAVAGDTLYVAELGDLPCEDPVPRCKGEQLGHPRVADGERQLLRDSSGRIVAFPISAEGLGDPEVLVEGLHFVNTDHGLNDLDLGPDGMLYLAVGNLDRLAWDDGGDMPIGPETQRIGSILRIDPANGAVDVFATGIRNVFALDFDGGSLWGVDNDGPGRGPWRFEELIRFEEGLDYGFPDDGTVGPYTRRTGFAEWIMPTGAGSSGLLVRGDVVISGGCGTVTRVGLESDTGDALVRTRPYPGCLTAIEPTPDGRLLLGTVLGEGAFSISTEARLLDD